MNRKEKENIIRKASEMGIPGNKICPEGKGAGFYRFLKSPEKTTERIINKMYNNAIKEMGEVSDTNSHKHATNIDTNIIIDGLVERVDELEHLVKKQQREIQRLQTQISLQTPDQKTDVERKRQAQHTDKFMGFNIRESTTVTTRGKKRYEYKKWYAVRNVKGRTFKVFVGSSFVESDARKKIELWLAKHPEVAKEIGQASDREYERFIEKVREISKQLMKRDSAKDARIWEIRKEMSSWRSVFNEFLRRMEKDKYIYLIEHSKPSELSREEKDGSVFDSRNGLLFYLKWRRKEPGASKIRNIDKTTRR